MTLKEWWHVRTDGVDGINKLIGEPGSRWRECVIKPGALAIFAAVAIWKAIRS